MPVYEVYKVGEDPRWVPGLDLLAASGSPWRSSPTTTTPRAAPTTPGSATWARSAWPGSKSELPDGAFVLGVDEHTALCLDLDAREAEVAGHGGVTVRVQGRSVRIESGQTMALGHIVELAAQLASGRSAATATFTVADAGADAGAGAGAGAAHKSGRR